ncbi:carotenoid oxygenase family protein [Mastigocoleus testarum]|uniref:Uncharacterized protein n=1 Tax=Mastigocoleus testarum BC008 TaxID=371196 RepID=A0A0V7ZH23_9CYAN|nr:carotenoid oxygenase family protein [Mastigocoleus testarum]KST63719.1 hypothetical protein BC008_14775 [Mastigocoleus testarum BC008]KST69217.1 hypothetical protein BC008_03240 [Mastigocoleus testarum BC008]
MQAINKNSSKAAWTKAIAQPGEEFPLTPLKILSGHGQIPVGLCGTLYRNGPGRLERGGIHVGHWFDGDGAILAVYFNLPGQKGGASAIYRYVETAGYKAETKAGKLLYSNYGMKAPGPFWNQWLRPVKNSANTSVLALQDKLLALWEGAEPYALDLKNLATLGKDNLGGLSDEMSYSAHPKIDAATGEIFNFGITPGRKTILNIYRSDSSGKILQKAKHQLEGIPLVHDFVLAGEYLVFFIPPVRLHFKSVLMGSSCFSNALKWEPELGTQILVLDRHSLQIVSRSETESWFQWHFANGFVDPENNLIVDMACYEDFQTNQFLKEVATGETHTVAESRLTRVTLNPTTGKVINTERILDRHCEFPIVPPSRVGKESRYTYFSIARQGTDIGRELLNGIARLNHDTNTITEAVFPDNHYPSEPIYVSDQRNPLQAWILTVVYNADEKHGPNGRSEVWVFDAARLNIEPVCKLELPKVIPPGFHGTWKQED